MQPEVYSIILAGGTGRRMPQDMPPKPCCKIGPLSVIENALQTYEEVGIKRHVMVVGCHAEEVMAEVCRTRSDVLFAFQTQPRGTGDAVRCALDLLAGVEHPEHVLISSGDKVIAPRAVRGVIEAYTGSGHDLCILAGPSRHYPSCGRVVVRNGRVLAIVELPDIRVRQLAQKLRSLPADDRPATVGQFRELASNYVSDVSKLSDYFPALKGLTQDPPDRSLPWEQVAAAAGTIPEDFQLRSGPVSLQEAASSELCNLSVYVGRFELLRDVVQKLGTDNVQGECYFTDAVEIMAGAGFKVGLFRIEDPQEAMTFNTLEQLEEVRKVHALRAQRRAPYPKLERWNNYFGWRDRKSLLAAAARGLGEKIGAEARCIVIRSPGRINLMGRHIDHQGGMCNLMAVDHEIVVAASAREDDRINLWNADSVNYPFRSFTVSELTADVVYEDWLRTLDSQYLQRMVSDRAGDWVNYVKGAALRLQHRFSDRKLRGMDAFVCGDIPVAAGLSSSSALVVAAAEALTELNALNMRPKEFVDLCGEGEWFVGTREGSADHAAIKFGRREEVVTVSFFPFEVVGHHSFPDDCSLVICHSGLSAEKMENARERFNAPVACYHMAREVIKEKHARFAPLVHHLRDVSTVNLGVSLPALYSLLRDVPVRVSSRDVDALAGKHPTVAKCVIGLDLGEHDFPLRDVAFYGLAECERSSRTGALLDRGDMKALGQMMNISHDGDRVTQWRPDRTPFDSRATDGLMESLIRRSASLHSLSDSGAALWQQPGAYDCSTPEIDLMVDRVLECPGVLGAQLAGAGLGGCIMVLAHKDCVDQAREVLEREYYRSAGIEPRMFVCQPAHGSQVLTTVEAPR